MSQDFTDDQSTLLQVMAWCRQATSHYLSQCLPRSLSPYGATRPQWVKINLIQEYTLYLFYMTHTLDMPWYFIKVTELVIMHKDMKPDKQSIIEIVLIPFLSDHHFAATFYSNSKQL